MSPNPHRLSQRRREGLPTAAPPHQTPQTSPQTDPATYSDQRDQLPVTGSISPSLPSPALVEGSPGLLTTFPHDTTLVTVPLGPDPRHSSEEANTLPPSTSSSAARRASRTAPLAPANHVGSVTRDDEFLRSLPDNLKNRSGDVIQAFKLFLAGQDEGPLSQRLLPILRHMCRFYQLPESGSKKELAQRLVVYVSCQSFLLMLTLTMS